MYKYLVSLLLLGCLAATAGATTYKVTGRVADTAGIALPGASVSLLQPEDSTLAVFGISNVNGDFAMTDVKEGSYLLQIAVMGYYTLYRKLTVPAAGGNDLGTMALQVNENAQVLNEVVISGEKVPMRLKGDTLEYNAGSFKVKPDAVVEDLLRKLPGVQVDKEGNIKSMGKDVSKVLVDGKEFFGNDPKIATKNLPADAIDKVQAFEKRSDESLFTGIDDGSREQTLNLLLKDNKKTGYFGEAKVGGGVPEQYDASVRAFKFRKKSQLAALGMLNNINKFGFTFEDYINFNGGLSSLMQSGGSISINSGDAPIDFGQPIAGKITSGAAGLNYSLEPWDKSRLNLSYLGNGIDKFLDQYTTSKNFTPGSAFEKEDRSEATTRNLTHRVSANLRAEADSYHLFLFNGYVKLGDSKEESSLRSESYQLESLQNRLNNKSTVWGDDAELGGTAGWTKKGKGKWALVQAKLQGAYTLNKEESQWYNTAYYPAMQQEINDRQYRHNNVDKTTGSAAVSAVRSLGKSYYLAPSLKAGYDRESVLRRQGPLDYSDVVVDSLSPDFYRHAVSISPGIELKRTLKKERWHIGLEWETVQLSSFLSRKEVDHNTYQYWLPTAWWQRDFGTGRRLSVRYNTEVTAPGALQLMPAIDYSNPLYRVAGNTDLKPEYAHSLNLNFNRFDQFNMSSFYIMMSGSYTKDKISWGRTIQPDLSQDMVAVNTDYALKAIMNAQYARPIRKLGLQVSASLQETWNKGISPVNNTDNINNTLSHQLELSFSNLNNDKWDLRWGGTAELTSASYSLNKELDNKYYNYSGFARIGYRPTDNWSFTVSGDITYYTASSFDDPLTIPLLKAEVTRYIFKNQRGAISLNGFDLLDKNKALSRTSQLNSLIEQRSNIIGRYVMLSFSYKLNRAGRKGDPHAGGLMIGPPGN
jgi:hypothetical protein